MGLDDSRLHLVGRLNLLIKTHSLDPNPLENLLLTLAPHNLVNSSVGEQQSLGVDTSEGEGLEDSFSLSWG